MINSTCVVSILSLCICWDKTSQLYSYNFYISSEILAVQGTQESSPAPQFKRINSLALSFLYSPTLTSIHDSGKVIALTRWTFVGKVMSRLFNMLSRLVPTFLPRNKPLLLSWLQSPSAVILEPPKTKSATVFIVSPSICHDVMGPDAMTSVFLMLSFKPTHSSQTIPKIRRGRNISQFIVWVQYYPDSKKGIRRKLQYL